MIRNGWKKGDWLVIDSESGMTRFSSQLKKDYTGEYVSKQYADYEQPQDFVKPLSDPRALPFSLPSDQNFVVDVSASPTVGNTSVPTPFGAASHLF